MTVVDVSGVLTRLTGRGEFVAAIDRLPPARHSARARTTRGGRQ